MKRRLAQFFPERVESKLSATGFLHSSSTCGMFVVCRMSFLMPTKNAIPGLHSFGCTGRAAAILGARPGTADVLKIVVSRSSTYLRL